MTEDPDADALSWDGDTDPTHAGAAAPPAGAAAYPRPATGSLLLIGYGIFAGIYLLMSLGWFAAVLRNTLTLPSLLPEIMYQFGEFLAIVAPALWMGTTLLLTRDRSHLVRVLWLVAGILVLLPWPVLLGRG